MSIWRKTWYILSAEHHPAIAANKVYAKTLHYLSVAINGRLKNYVCWIENSYHAEVTGRKRRRREKGRMREGRMRGDSKRGSGK